MPVGMLLKNTGIGFRFSVSASANSDGTIKTEKGTMPDIPCIKEDALKKCLDIIGEE